LVKKLLSIVKILSLPPRNPQVRDINYFLGLVASKISPIKTRSSQKKQVDSSIQVDVIVPSSLDIRALREMKALAREK
jgi:hypothetical protein